MSTNPPSHLIVTTPVSDGLWDNPIVQTQIMRELEQRAIDECEAHGWHATLPGVTIASDVPGLGVTVALTVEVAADV